MKSKIFTIAAAFGVAATYTCHAADPLLGYKAEIAVKAQPDECFYGLGDPRNSYEKGGIDCDACLLDGGIPKTNQAYVWGLVKTPDHLWWGTGPNVNLLVGGVYFGSETGRISENARGFTPTTAAECQAHPWATCRAASEYGQSRFAQDGIFDGDEQMGDPVPAGLGDWRPPDAYRYNLDTEQLDNLIDFIPDLDTDPDNAANPDWENPKELLWKSLGWRSAGHSPASGEYSDGLVFLGGPSITATLSDGDGIILFCFDAEDASFVAAKSFPQFSNIRKWKRADDGTLYTAIATQTGSGEVLKWLNDPNHVDYPFAFEVVGAFPSGGAELEIHQNRLYVGTWPGIEGNFELGPDNLDAILALINGPASLWCSPDLSGGPLDSGDANNWTMVWNAVDYDPDIVRSLHFGCGAMASFGDYLYWGTMHVPGTSGLLHSIAYGNPPLPTAPVEPGPDATEQELADYAAALAQYEIDLETYEDLQDEDGNNSYRSISIWRGKPVAANAQEDDDGNVDGMKVELLYGEETMQVRMNRRQFIAPNDNNPRNEIQIGWGAFFSEKLGSLRDVPDNQNQPFWIIPYVWTGTRNLPDGGAWQEMPNTSGFIPKWGGESIQLAYGFYPVNNYTWTMQVFQGKLYVGTMDFLGLGHPQFESAADLFCFPDTESPAVRVSASGIASVASYGVRTIAADDERGELYLGMANVNNLLNTKVGDFADGGWELQVVTHRFQDDDFDELDDAWEAEYLGGVGALNTGSGDSDGDEQSDTDEMIAGTNPNDPKSFFFTVQAEGEGEGMQQLEWPSALNRFYIVYAATELGENWSPVAIYEGTGSALEHEYDPSESPAKFFKVEATFDDPELLL